MRQPEPQRRKRRPLWGLFKLTIFLLLVAIVVPLVGMVYSCAPWREPVALESWVDSDERAEVWKGRPEAVRLEDQTYLTLPEWYVVYSADEYAAFVAENPPSNFPYFSALRQYWSSTYTVCGVVRGRYGYNGRYQTLLAIVGSSFTLEYLIKGLYENSVGRLTELISDNEPTPEDEFAQEVAAEYGTFLHTIPWFEFPFDEKLEALWALREERDAGHPLRRWERRLALSAEYGVKYLYGRLIGGANEAAYEPVDVEITVWLTGLNSEVLRSEGTLRVVEDLEDAGRLVVVPRYEAFSQQMPRLAAAGVELVEIAGNRNIMVTLLAEEGWEYGLPVGEQLSEMPILSAEGQKRVVVQVPVAQLHRLLNNLAEEGAELEHIYDY